VKTFIRIMEYWVPSRDRTYLEYGGGSYGNAKRFGALSRALCFARGEGLPGQAWEAGHPIVLKELEGSVFRRTEAARAEGLTCGIAVPIFAGDFLTAVMVIFCGDDDAHAGAIELWRNDAAASKDMTLVDGYYGTTGDSFEFISRRASFRRGHGLPGLAWERGVPVFMEDLGKSARFLRADSAVRVGINRGLAIPCPTRNDEHYVIAFLSALATPIARRLEMWEPDASRSRLHRTAGFCEVTGVFGESTDGPWLDRGQGTIGTPFLTGIPAASDQAGSEPAGIGASAQQAGLEALVAMPVLRDGRLAAVVAWYF
jgi:hypothetical protein